jgi:PIN domain nuclease of toxin-antitoxin system
MATFDAAPLVGMLLAEPGASTIARVLAEAGTAAISTINLAEMIERVVRHGPATIAAIDDRIDLWRAGGLAVIPLSEQVAHRAASIRAAHFHARRAAVSLADCCAIALAEERDEPLATSDRAMLAVARACGVAVVPLPDSTGTVPQ